MSKNDIIKELSQQLKITKNMANKAYDIFMEAIISTIETKKSIRLHKLGTLHIIQCKEKKYHNPQTNSLEVLSPKKRVKFRASKSLSQRVT